MTGSGGRSGMKSSNASNYPMEKVLLEKPAMIALPLDAQGPSIQSSEERDRMKRTRHEAHVRYQCNMKLLEEVVQTSKDKILPITETSSSQVQEMMQREQDQIDSLTKSTHDINTKSQRRMER